MWWKRGRCQSCNRKFGKNEHKAELRLGNEENGIKTLEICQWCADVLDASADILRRKKKSDER